MSELNEKLLEIKRQKDTYIIPENLRKNVEVFGITGTYEGSGGGSGDVKLFDTIEHMQADPNPSEGDLAVVYREELTAITEETEFDNCIFPNEVVLDEAFSDNIYGSFRSIGSSYFDGMVDISSSSFSFDGWGEGSQVRIEYESQDGITYTRTDSEEELQEFGTTIKWEGWGDPFNSVIGNFMKIGGNYFEGMYEYNTNIIDTNYYNFLHLDDLIITDNTISNYSGIETKCSLSTQELIDIVKNLNFPVTRGYQAGTFYLDSQNRLNLLTKFGQFPESDSEADKYCSGTFSGFLVQNNTINSISSNEAIIRNIECKRYIVNIVTKEITLLEDVTTYLHTYYNSSTNNTYTWFDLTDIDCKSSIIYVDSGSLYSEDYSVISGLNYYIGTPPSISFQGDPLSSLIHKNYTFDGYIVAKNQLDTTSDYVYEKTFYGKNGIETGSLGVNMLNSFNDISAQVFSYLQIQYENMPTIKITDSTWNLLSNKMITIPRKLNGELLIDTSEVTKFTDFNNYVRNIKYIPTLNMSNAQNCYAMFYGCSNILKISDMAFNNVTNISNMFNGCSNLIEAPNMNTTNVTSSYSLFNRCQNLVNVPNYNLSNTITTYEMFASCSNLVNVPDFNICNSTYTSRMFIDCKNLISAPILDTRNVIQCNLMFYSCSNLVNVPVYNMPKVNAIYSMFWNCLNLSNESLNNIMATCISMTNSSLTNKTLKNIGLSQNQVNICMNLSNFSNFISAGWTTGY